MSWDYSKCIFQEQNVEHLQGKAHIQRLETRPNVAQPQEELQ